MRFAAAVVADLVAATTSARGASCCRWPRHTQLVGLVWAYIYRHDLKKSDGKVVCDSLLQRALGVAVIEQPFKDLSRLVGNALLNDNNSSSTSTTIVPPIIPKMAVDNSVVASASITPTPAVSVVVVDIEDIDTLRLANPSSIVTLTKKDLGDGSFGKVFKGTYKPAGATVGEDVAVKELKWIAYRRRPTSGHLASCCGSYFRLGTTDEQRPTKTCRYDRSTHHLERSTPRIDWSMLSN